MDKIAKVLALGGLVIMGYVLYKECQDPIKAEDKKFNRRHGSEWETINIEIYKEK